MMRPERASVRFAKENSRRNCSQRHFRFSISCCSCCCVRCCQLDTKISSRNSICRGRSEGRSCCCCFFICSTRFLRLRGAFSLHIPPNIFRSCDSLAATHTHTHTPAWVSLPLSVSLSACLPLVLSYHSRFLLHAQINRRQLNLPVPLSVPSPPSLPACLFSYDSQTFSDVANISNCCTFHLVCLSKVLN